MAFRATMDLTVTELTENMLLRGIGHRLNKKNNSLKLKICFRVLLVFMTGKAESLNLTFAHLQLVELTHTEISADSMMM